MAAEPSHRQPSGRSSHGPASGFTLRLGKGRFLAVGGNGDKPSLTPPGCARPPAGPRYPEAGINVTGEPHAGATRPGGPGVRRRAHPRHGLRVPRRERTAASRGTVRRAGALVDCPDHASPGQRRPARVAPLREPHHDPVGWPTFKDWPAPKSLTHEGTYYKWLERSWRGGQRIFVNLLVENNQLCSSTRSSGTPATTWSPSGCRPRLYLLQDYIDAQFGGPGKGFYRIVKSPSRHAR